MLTCVQFGLTTTDMAGALRLYSEAFGFENAGGQGLWGKSIIIQDLPPDSRATMWWMIGAQPFFQLEFFQYTRPAQRLRPGGWRPCDHGWVRFGISVPDYDRALAGIAAFDIALTGQGQGPDGQRRCAFYDPFIGTVVEVREEKGTAGPSAIYAAASVSDLDAARHYYGELIGFELGELSELHEPEDESLWGLKDAQRDGFVVRSGDVKLEILRYDMPQGKPRRADHRASDQHFLNVALGSRIYSEVAQPVERLKGANVRQMNIVAIGQQLIVYVNDAEREAEFCVVPEELDDVIGFKSKGPFFG